jgi:hypothetical protein
MNLFTRQERTLLLIAVLTVIGTQVGWAQGPWYCGTTTTIVDGNDSVNATLNGNTLKIQGAGPMGPQPHPAAGGAPWYSSRNLIDHVVIGSGVTSIGDHSFCDLTMMESITIPKTVVSIGGLAFSGCTRYSYITIPNGVTSIGVSAFANNTHLTEIIIPNTVTTVGGWAFSGCTALTSAAISNRLDSIGNYMFSGCTALENVDIPNRVKSIGAFAFSGCSSLMSIIIPESVKSIGGSAFDRCTGLTSINIPNGVTTIQSFTFKGCTNLTSIIIPEGVTTIQSAAFQGCTGLTSIRIPSSVISIGDGVFDGSLKTVICHNPVPPKISNATFLNTKIDICLYVPGGSIADYTSANYWKNFSCIQDIRDTLKNVSVTAKDRVVPAVDFDGNMAAVAPINRLTAEFTAGPNPVGRSFGIVSFFRYGSRIESATLYVYDASGNSVSKVAISDNTVAGNKGRRAVGLWDLRDAKGRQVSEGTYLVRGVIKTSDGKTEQVSSVVGVR